AGSDDEIPVPIRIEIARCNKIGPFGNRKSNRREKRKVSLDALCFRTIGKYRADISSAESDDSPAIPAIARDQIGNAILIKIAGRKSRRLETTRAIECYFQIDRILQVNPWICGKSSCKQAEADENTDSEFRHREPPSSELFTIDNFLSQI